MKKQAEHIIMITKACKLDSIAKRVKFEILKFWREITVNVRDVKIHSDAILMQVCSQSNKNYYGYISALFPAIGGAAGTGIFRNLSNIEDGTILRK